MLLNFCGNYIHVVYYSRSYMTQNVKFLIVTSVFSCLPGNTPEYTWCLFVNK